MIAIQGSNGAYCCRSGSPHTIRLIRADNTGTLPSIHGVQANPGSEFLAAAATFSWSPDSHHLVIVAFHPGRQSTIDTVNINDDRRKELLENPRSRSSFGDVAWSPNGSKIAFTTSVQKTDTMPLHGGRFKTTVHD